VAKPIVVRHAAPAEWPKVERFYRDRKYRGEVSLDAHIVMAERGKEMVGVGRVQAEQGVLVLRGMRVDPECQRRGVGSRILDQLAGDLNGRRCYCLPYRHLRAFYGRAGFFEIDPQAAPAFLRARLHDYRAAGLDVTIMQR
jgi:N-acetylglutamate synthase-like GNAT family acetyltransferase